MAVLSPVMIAWTVAGRDGHRDAAVEIGEQDHPAGALAGQIDAPDHAAGVHHRLARLDVLVFAGVQDHGLQEGTAGAADHPRQHAN